MLLIGQKEGNNYIDILICQIQMSNNQEIIEEKLRKSTSLTEQQIYQDFMQLAQSVRDEYDVYVYMEENEIGIDKGEYWVARFKVMQKRCQLINLVKSLKLVKKMKISNLWLLQSFEKELQADMVRCIYSSNRGKRSAEQYITISRSKIHPQKRKIGGIQIYVDEQCRRNYSLEDYSEFIETKLIEYCEIQRQQYKRSQQRKPLSFIGKRQENLINLTKQMITKNRRTSQKNRETLNIKRESQKINLKNNISDQQFETPKNIKLENEVTNNGQKQKLKRKSSRDSIEILKSIRKSLTRHSPCFKKDTSCEINIKNNKSFQSPRRQQMQVLRGVNKDFLLFSFRNDKGVDQPKKGHKAKSESFDNDKAFIFNSFSKDSNVYLENNPQFIQKQDFELELIIKEIQRQTYELDGKTISSDIDSNQQNKYFDQYQKQGKDMVNQDEKSHRKPFVVLLQSEPPYFGSKNEFNLQDLIDCDESFQKNYENGSKQDQQYKNRQKIKKPINQLLFRSGKQKRLSNISQQNSSFFSQIKKHNLSN